MDTAGAVLFWYILSDTYTWAMIKKWLPILSAETVAADASTNKRIGRGEFSEGIARQPLYNF